jgi:hypothetical protein
MSNVNIISTAAVLASLIAAASGRAEPRCEPNVHSSLSDGHDLIPGGLAPVRAAIEQELLRLGVLLTWINNEDTKAPGPILRVVLLPHGAADWGRSDSTLGAVRLGGDSPSSIYVFYPAVKQVIGAPTDTTSILGGPSGRIWVRALARIVLHEMIHFLLPGRPHDTSGLFAQNLSGRDLLGSTLSLAPETKTALVDQLCQTTR